MNRGAAMEAFLRRAWRGEGGAAALLLIPLGWIWRAAAAIRRAMYASFLLRTHRAPAPVISVGNLVVGGAGKTPATLEIARRLLAAGRRPAVLSRGWGRVPGARVVVVSDGETVGATAQEGGDEPLWFARRLPGLIVVVAARRVDSARTAVELGADVLLLDDGLSHLALRRDADVVVVDSELGLGNGRMLPAGPLREPPSVAREAALLWLTRCEGASQAPPPGLGALPAVRSSFEPAELCDLKLRPAEGVETLQDARVIAVCGIARPESFERSLREAGANVRALAAYPDHHRFSAQDVLEAEQRAARERCALIVTTEKDAMRLALLPCSGPWRALRMEVRLLGSTEALDGLLRRFAPAL